jgi:hypothetical protein
MVPEEFVLRISDAAIADLKTRLNLTRLPDAAPSRSLTTINRPDGVASGFRGSEVFALLHSCSPL